MASGSSSAARPWPSSATRMRVRPPPSAWTSTRVAPASSAFSTSSLTGRAGRSTTSPAAMRLTVSGGRRRIGMRSAYDRRFRRVRVRPLRRFRRPMRLGVLAATAALTWPALAQTPPTTPYDPDAVLVEELVVVGRLPGPAWWSVSDADTTVYVLGSPTLAPKRMAWDRAIFEKRLAGANQVIVPYQDVRVTMTGAFGAAFNYLRLKSSTPFEETLD